jgi:hypothetical protein
MPPDVPADLRAAAERWHRTMAWIAVVGERLASDDLGPE